MKIGLGAAQPNRNLVWALALIILALQLAFSGLLFAINVAAENIEGRRIDGALIADAGIAEPALLPDAAFAATSLPAEACCSTAPIDFRVRLDDADAARGDPAILIVSAHDNARLYVDGVLIAGEGLVDRGTTVLARRPLLMRIPKTLARPGARIDVVVERAVGFGHLRPFYIGEYRALYRSYGALRMLRSDIPMMNAVIGAFVAAFCLCAAPLFGARGLLFSLSALGLSWALQHVGLLMTDPPWGALANDGLYLFAFLTTLICVIWFFVEWTSVLALPLPPRQSRLTALLLDPWPEPDRAKLALGAAIATVLGAIAIAVRLSHDPAIGLQDINRVIDWFGLAALAFCAVRIIAFYARSGLRDPIEASAFLFVIVAALADISMVRFVHSYGIFLSAAVMFFPLALLVSLAVRARGIFEAATATVEKLNVLVDERETTIVAGMQALQRRERESVLLEERARIMRDMHDGIGGHLLGLILQARSKKLSPDALVDGLEEGLNDLRLVVDSLDQGEGTLTNALGVFRARIEPRCAAAGVTLDWEIEDVGATPDIGPDKTLQIYRILQEACTNALKHGAPKHIRVTSRKLAAGCIEIALSDDGRRFDPENAAPGRGIANMKQRAAKIGADLQIISDSAGARVVLLLKTGLATTNA